MQVAKWGNSLAIRLPKAVVEVLNLKAGDEVEITIAGDRQFKIARDRKRGDALKRLRALQRPLPPGFKFSREKAHER
jgi:antitoxin MazE